jgi:hypothetical protein
LDLGLWTLDHFPPILLFPLPCRSAAKIRRVPVPFGPLWGRTAACRLFVIRISAFVIHSSFGFRISSFPPIPPLRSPRLPGRATAPAVARCGEGCAVCRSPFNRKSQTCPEPRRAGAEGSAIENAVPQSLSPSAPQSLSPLVPQSPSASSPGKKGALWAALNFCAVCQRLSPISAFLCVRLGGETGVLCVLCVETTLPLANGMPKTREKSY